ncbi:hemagglutinin, partial [Prochlorococcus sp. AH-736-K20]
MELRFFPINVFRETPKVTFFDAGINISNGSDVVIHSGEAISPPDDSKDEQYYVHNHQTDHNLVITGERTFVLINPSWDEPHHVIYLNRSMGALEIPIGTYHRSISGKEGSIVLNQP